MIHSRITSKAQTTIPRAIRDALGVEPGDSVLYEIDGDKVIMRRMPMLANSDPFENPFALFTEWADELDCEAFDNL